MAQFLILLYDNPQKWQQLSPEEMQKAIEKYRAWTQKPCNVTARRLADDAGRVLRPQSGKARVSDGPFIESKEVLGGFYLIEAANYEAAVELAQGHPHLEYGGTIEIRKVWED
jgi:hypothetical protein